MYHSVTRRAVTFLSTYIIGLEIRMCVLEAIIQYRDHNSVSSDVLLPSSLHVHVMMIITMLWGGKGKWTAAQNT